MTTKRNIETAYGLSPMQQGMLFHSLVAPESGVYCAQLTCTLVGDLNLAAFERAWQQVIDRNPVLRTAFAWKRLEKPLQAVHRQVTLTPTYLDWRHLAAEQQTEHMAEYLTADRRQGFDLSRAPVMRLALIRLSDRTHQLIWSHHHILLDGWSMPILLKEVFTFYGAYATGRAINLPPTRPYREYIAWLQGQDQAAAEAFWRKTLAGFTAPTPLVVSRETRLHGVAEQEVTLSAATSATLQTLARQHGLTFSTVIQAAWGLLLGRYSRERNVVFGATVSGRPATLPGSEAMVGLFINTLPMRIRIDPDAPVSAWLQGVQANLAEMRQFEHSPLVQVQGWSDVPREMPLFESIVVFENYPVDTALREQLGGAQSLLEGIQIRNIRAIEQTNYPLTAVSGSGREVQLKISYDLARFDDATITRMLGHWRTLLEGIAAAPQSRVRDIPMLSMAERHQVLVAWNATDQPRPHELLVHQIFEAQAERTPDAPALIFVPEVGAQVVFTYAELNAQANQLAHYLREMGVGPDTLVGLMVERSPEMIIGLLGILKAGGAYLPLDPAYPTERINFMLADSRAQVLVTTRRLQESTARGDFSAAHRPTSFAFGHMREGTRYVLLDDDWTDIAQRPGVSNPALTANRQSIAYVIYTSGSTGQAKGVMVTHGGLANHALDLQRLYQIMPGDRNLLVISLSFDAAGEAIYSSLLNGGALVLTSRRVEMDGDALTEICEQEQISVLTAPTPVWHMWVEALSARQPSSPTDDRRLAAPLRLAVVGGESPSVSKLAAWLKLLPLPTYFVNAYGPTEATVAATHFIIANDDARLSTLARLPIGPPGLNMRAFVLDEEMEPVPIGVPGELYIGGAGVARGYLNRPDLTAERFLPNPFAAIDAQAPDAEHRPSPFADRLYRTGDLVRWLPDGNLEFLGRADEQVKIRGFRVEPGEVEAVLAEYPEIVEAALAVHNDVAGGKRLVGYVVPKLDKGFELADVRSYLALRLPEYMTPSTFVTLDALPRTPSGKIDRRALPAPEGQGAATAPYVAPQTPDEELLAGIFGQILGLRQVSIQDSFFELGGHSLLATRLASRVREVCGVELSLRSLFETPTVAGIARKVAAARQATATEPLPPMVVAPREADAHGLSRMPLSFAQQRLWFLDQLEPGNLFYNIPAVMRLHGHLDVPALTRAIDAIVQRHEVLRTTFAAADGVPVQVIAPTMRIPVMITNLTHLPQLEREAEARRLATDVVRTPFDLSAGPLLRVHLFKLQEDDHIAALVMHHIATDGWSMGILINELATLYGAFSRGETTSRLPHLPLQYADYAAWQRNWLKGETLEQQLVYWKQQLAGAPPLLDLPTDRPRPAVQTANGGLYTFCLPRALSEELLRFNQAQGVTLFMTLLAGYQALLARYAGQPDVIVGSAIANRTRIEVEPLIGFFVNTLAFRARFHGNPSFKALLSQVRETALAAYAHQDVPFEMLVDALQLKRNLSHTPLFQAAFSLQNVPIGAIELPGLRFEPMTIEKGIAQYDMLLMMSETPDGITGAWEYNSDLFDHSTIERMASHLQNLLASAIAAPDEPVDDLPILSEAERELMLMKWNDSAVPFPDHDTVHALFEAQAEAQPEAPAIAYIADLAAYRRDEPAAVLSYGELNHRANQLAHHLHGLGVGPDTLVGLLVQRSLDMVVGILGILKAGGAYLPIDPTYPPDRIAFMLADSGVGVLVTQESVWGRIAGEIGVTSNDVAPAPPLRFGASADEHNQSREELVSGTEGSPGDGRFRHPLVTTEGVTRGGERAPSSQPPLTSTHYALRIMHCVLLDRDWPAIAQHPPVYPPQRHASLPTADNLAYCIYTSGSTGRPKGALLRHRGLCNLADVQGRAFDIRPGKRVLQFSPFSFDASVWETVMALRNGATLVLADQEIIASGVALQGLLRAAGITTVTLPPSLLAVLEPADLPDLETVIAAGERCTDEIVAKWAPGRRFFNAYGPTETTVCASMFLCDPNVTWPFGGPPIGSPIANFQLYVVDERMQPQPIGVAGELLVGGVGLAAGYLNRPELTAERFVPNPFAVIGNQLSAIGNKPSAPDQRAPISDHRVYRTGDLVRWLPSGVLEYIGRADDQVKVRGFRIELGEIEAVLRDYPTILDAVVAAHGDTLHAYYIPAGATEVATTKELAPLHSNDFSRPEATEVVTAKELTALRSGDFSRHTTAAELKAHLRRRLPEYMMPATFTALETFPRSPAGKVDRRHLPAPDQTAHKAAVAHLAPRNPVEEKLAHLCADLLNLERVSVEDSFFELGGHSLLATQLISRIRDEFQVEIPLRMLFEQPTVAGLAQRLAAAVPAQAETAKIVDVMQSIKDLSPEQVKALLAAKKAQISGPDGPVKGAL